VTSPAIKTKLDKPLIVEAALRLLEDVGLDGLSTRALAAALGVKGPSLYWHFENMGELKDLMADAILAEVIPAVDQAVDWRTWLADGARAIRGAALARRDGARLLAGSRPGARRRLRIPANIARLEAEGFSNEAARAAFVVLSRYALGSALGEQAATRAPSDATFEFGLMALLDGLDTQRRPANA
jgi:TetR/AcrR family tetracycline transcriptional repressor